MVTMTQMMVMMISFVSMFKHAKGFGNCASLVLRTFKNKRVALLCGRRHLAPPLACLLRKQRTKRFVISRNTWGYHVGTFSAIPINIQFPENYDDDFMSDQVGRLFFQKQF